MIHPDTELKFIHEDIGYGVFATSDIAEGTIVYVKDSLERVIAPQEYAEHSEEIQNVIEKYSYIDESGNRIVSWDFAKYVNHCCHCNTISTGYGFEIAIRNIKKGEQITDEYGIFNLEKPMNVACGALHCRQQITPADFDNYYEEWDKKIRKSIVKIFRTEQPLLPLLDPKTKSDLEELQAQPEKYKSVYALKYKSEVSER